MKKFLLLLSVCFIAFGQVLAQSQTISGTVLNAADDEPIIGASVQVKGTSKGTITDVDGKFSLEVEPASVLVVSFIGMGTQEVAAKDGVVINLMENSKELEEVMVVAFGTSTKKSFTGAASVVKADEITKRQTSNVTNALAGQVAGVQGFNVSGAPGSTATIRIRGVGSMNASSAPLYVIDGVPASGEDVTTLSNSDIESVTVLKDAASNALYGARGANGVILITTKRGNTRDAQIKLEAKWGVNQRGIPSYDVMRDPGMYYENYYRALYNQFGSHDQANELLCSSSALGYQVFAIPEGERLVGTNFKLNPRATAGYVSPSGYMYKADNWYNELFNSNNLRQEYNVSISGSTDKLTYFTSASYLDDSGIIENSGFRRITTRVNVDYQAKKWLKIGTNMSYSHADQRDPLGDSEGSHDSKSFFYVVDNIAPIYPLYVRDANGNIMRDANGYTIYDYGEPKTNGGLSRPFMGQSNPASAISLDRSLYKMDVFTGKWFVQVEPVKGLKFNATLGFHYTGTRYNTTTNPFYGQYAERGGLVSVEADRYTGLDQLYTVTYARKFGEHNIDALVGYENYHLQTSYVWGSRDKLFSPFMAELNNAISNEHTGSASDSYFTQGILVQAKYDYASRYYVSASYRRDASSRFAPGKQWGNFWSVGAAWDIKGESFMDGVQDVDLLKLKASYGSQGNDVLNRGGYHPWADQYDIVDNNGGFATTLAHKGNPDITWETSYNFNAGIDFGFFGERLTGTIEGWRRRTVDMLYFRPVPASLGYSEIPVNIGSMSNAGMDVELHGQLIKTRNITWSVYLNLTFMKNRILQLSPELKGQYIDGSRIYREGESMYNLYLPAYAGVDPATGKSLWYIDVEDPNNPGQMIIKGGTTDTWSTANANFKYATGDIMPQVYGGFGTTLDVYGVDLSIAFNYQAGGRVIDYSYLYLMHGGYGSGKGYNWHLDILNAWTPENTNTNVPKVDAGDPYVNAMSDRWLTSSNYVSLQNITLGYTFPAKLTKKAHIEKIRLYAVADNVWLWSARKGFDPRQSYTSSSNAYYSPMRTISGGLSITF